MRATFRWVLVILLLALLCLSAVACAGFQPGPGSGTPGATPTQRSGY
jgi:lipopolysaccharide export system protein LptC